jgi:hypothetical protein
MDNKKIILSTLLISITLSFSSCAKKNFEQEINSMNEQEQIKTIKQNVFSVKYIKNPTEAVQLEAVKQNGNSIEYFNNPSEAVQLEAVKEANESIKYIKNPSETVQLEAIKRSGIYIRHINNPTETVQLEAVKKDGNFISLIKNPSEAVQLEAVKQNGYAIQNIGNPSENIKFEASKSIKYVKDNIKTKIKEFNLIDKNIKIDVLTDDTYSISNLTTQFIKIKIISFYYGKTISSLEDINLPPKSSKEIPFPNNSLKYASNEKTINFGFAVNYYLNEKNLDLYKVQQYPFVEFLYKR